MTLKQVTNSFLSNPQGHFRNGNCNECGYHGHWEYACKLLDIKWKKKFTKHAQTLAKRSIHLTQVQQQLQSPSPK